MTPPLADTIAAAFRQACALDVAVRKPGNVSEASPGHRMVAQQFLQSADAAAPALCAPGTRIGTRIEAAMRATWDAVGCNTNLGIVLLCAPLARAAERLGPVALEAATLHAAVQVELDELDVHDAAAAFRAIALVQPGGLGRTHEQDVHTPPTVTLREAMALASARDRIAQQYTQGFEELFSLGVPALADGISAGAVQRCFLQWLRSQPDTHIMRKHGATAAHSVQVTAQSWWDTLLREGPPVSDLATHPHHAAQWAEWDEGLKACGLNPGTSADLTVASAFAALLLRRPHR